MSNGFQHMNCIVVFSREKDSVLFCRRKKEPYAGLFNFVGGKVEADESSEDAAYRELLEETGIGRTADLSVQADRFYILSSEVRSGDIRWAVERERDSS